MTGGGRSILYLFIYLLFYILATFITLLCIFLLFYKCYRQIPSSSSATAAAAAAVPPSRRGLQPSDIQTLPTFRFSASGSGKSRSECAVCLGGLEDDETLRLMPVCGHVFHSVCVDAWLRDHTTCPYCRAAVLPPSGAGEPPDVGIVVAPPPP